MAVSGWDAWRKTRRSEAAVSRDFRLQRPSCPKVVPGVWTLGGLLSAIEGYAPQSTGENERMSDGKSKTGLLNWLGKAVSGVLDPDREARLQEYVAKVDAEISRLRHDFDFSKTAARLDMAPSDEPIVSERLYRQFLERAWKDQQITAREIELLAWVADALELGDGVVARLNYEFATARFRKAFAQAMSDGRVDEAEAARLQAIASGCGQTVGGLVSHFFKAEGEPLLRSIFSGFAMDGQIDKAEWQSFQETVERLGVPRELVLQAIQTPAHQLVEHALADARVDGEISENEERGIEWLLRNVVGDTSFAAYVRREIAETKEMQALQKGVLPSVAAPPGTALRAGEIVHWFGPAKYVRKRELASGIKFDEVDGELVITDTRTILNAQEKSLELNHRKVLAHVPFGDGIEIRSGGKGSGHYIFARDGERAVPIWQVAIGRANQTIVVSDDKAARRRISREVRQRVWQRYGGRCAECQADTYLEFDHIVPVAKGGSNSDTNVQLLCRKCNLAKSDNI